MRQPERKVPPAAGLTFNAVLICMDHPGSLHVRTSPASPDQALDSSSLGEDGVRMQR